MRVFEKSQKIFLGLICGNPAQKIESSVHKIYFPVIYSVQLFKVLKSTSLIKFKLICIRYFVSVKNSLLTVLIITSYYCIKKNKHYFFFLSILTRNFFKCKTKI